MGEVRISGGIFRGRLVGKGISQTLQQNVFMHLLLNAFEMVRFYGYFCSSITRTKDEMGKDVVVERRQQKLFLLGSLLKINEY